MRGIEEKEVIVEIDADGVVTVDLKGYHGHGCKKEMEAIVKGMGKVIEDREKPEANENRPMTTQLRRTVIR